MARLGQELRAVVHKDFCDQMGRSSAETIGITKHDIADAIQAADAWVDDNAASFNAALPQPARGALSARQKARVMMLVLQRRYEVI